MDSLMNFNWVWSTAPVLRVYYSSFVSVLIVFLYVFVEIGFAACILNNIILCMYGLK